MCSAELDDSQYLRDGYVCLILYPLPIVMGGYEWGDGFMTVLMCLVQSGHFVSVYVCVLSLICCFVVCCDVISMIMAFKTITTRA